MGCCQVFEKHDGPVEGHLGFILAACAKRYLRFVCATECFDRGEASCRAGEDAPCVERSIVGGGVFEVMGCMNPFTFLREECGRLGVLSFRRLWVLALPCA